jgi:hypothetical protein
LAECRRKKPVDDRLFFVGLILDAKKIARKNKKKIGPIYDSVTPDWILVSIKRNAICVLLTSSRWHAYTLPSRAPTVFSVITSSI